jgi:hypothetical protein
MEEEHLPLLVPGQANDYDKHSYYVFPLNEEHTPPLTGLHEPFDVFQ